jgi:diguanylate cyclase (GGDEF)-like protein/PAS domain S-box-containing protein
MSRQGSTAFPVDGKNMRFLQAAKRHVSRINGRAPGRDPAFSSLSRRSAGYALLACAALVALEGWNGWHSRDAAVEGAATATSNLTRSLAQHTEDLLDRADTVLTGLVERVGTDGTAPAALARLDDLLRREAERPPGATAFFVYDAEGNRLATSLPQAPAGLTNAERDYFRHHRDHDDPAPFVGPVIRSQTRGIWTLTLSRRLQTADGRFAGVALATIDADYLSRFFAGFDLGRQGAAALFRSDGVLLSRQPFIESDAGRSYAHLPLFRDWLPRAATGTYWIASPFDGVMRLNSYRRAERYPLVLAAAVSEQEALASWRRETAIRLPATALVILVLGFLGLRLARQVQRRHMIEQALAESEANFRLLAENSSDVVTRIGLDGRRTYVSPAVQRLLGFSPAELISRPANEYINPADLPSLQAQIAQLESGTLDEATVTYRIRRRGGEEIWLESSIRSTHDPVTGALDGAVAVSRNVTQRRKLEQQLEELATTDGLTGLANRRAFDEALEQEWRRAQRGSQPLSLLLLDVDRFKRYNDTYGHQEGDHCLRAVAALVNAAVRRPGDVAARYGGEEMVLLLPNTGARAALGIAERLRAGLEAARLPHAANPPSGVVTASIGVAGLLPDAQLRFGPEALLAAADSALYAAKHQGRNRVMLAAEVPPPPMPAPAPADEEARLQTAQAFAAAAATGSADPELDRLTRLAARLFDVPTALISLVERERQVFVARSGFALSETPRAASFCAHLLGAGQEVLVVPDAAADARFANNPLVTGDAGVRFYAGAALVAPGTDHRLGALCVMDQVPHPPLDPLQQAVLKDLAALAVSRMEQRRNATAG